MIEKMALKLLKSTKKGKLEIIDPKDKLHTFEGDAAGATARIHIKDWAVARHTLLKGDVGFAKDYQKGLWTSDDLVSVLRFFIDNEDALGKMYYGAMVSRSMEALKYILRLNNISGARRNVQKHYDLSNDFYRLWLDETMTYSSALFRNSDDSLEAAQNHKYQRILSQLEGQSGALLEVGCGWGGFIRHALTAGDFRVKGITLSQEQKTYTDRLLRECDLKAEIGLEDYRRQDSRQGQKYDHIVSIEMFEAVGERYWSIYFEKLASLLKAKGVAVVQAITIQDAFFDSYRKSSDALRSYIFPGGMLPSPSRFVEKANAAGLHLADKFEFGLDYAKTLRLWLERFNKNQKGVLALGFEEDFIRLWHYYLAMCIAGFEAERINVMQTKLVPQRT